jgi:hypothetical protein
VQGLLSLHTLAAPRHAPAALHTSASVHGFPSEQVAPGSAGLTQSPLFWLQLSAVQGLASLQFLACPGWQAPPAQVSLVVHGFPSLQGAVLLANVQP